MGWTTRPVPEVSAQGRIFLLRHGETEWSRTGRHTGTTDLDLTDAGQQEARKLQPALAGRRFVLTLCSPRLRARRTAELAGLDPIELDDDLAEWRYGDYEGRTTAQIREHDPDWTIWTGRTPGGETADEIAARADRVVSRLTRTRDAGDIAVVGHGHFTRALTARWLGLPVDAGRLLLLQTATVGILDVQRETRAIGRWNVPAEGLAGRSV